MASTDSDRSVARDHDRTMRHLMRLLSLDALLPFHADMGVPTTDGAALVARVRAAATPEALLASDPDLGAWASATLHPALTPTSRWRGWCIALSRLDHAAWADALPADTIVRIDDAVRWEERNAVLRQRIARAARRLLSDDDARACDAADWSADDDANEPWTSVRAVAAVHRCRMAWMDHLATALSPEERRAVCAAATRVLSELGARGLEPLTDPVPGDVPLLRRVLRGYDEDGHPTATVAIGHIRAEDLREILDAPAWDPMRSPLPLDPLAASRLYSAGITALAPGDGLDWRLECDTAAEAMDQAPPATA